MYLCTGHFVYLYIWIGPTTTKHDKKSRIQETLNISACADSSTNTFIKSIFDCFFVVVDIFECFHIFDIFRTFFGIWQFNFFKFLIRNFSHIWLFKHYLHFLHFWNLWPFWPFWHVQPFEYFDVLGHCIWFEIVIRLKKNPFIQFWKLLTFKPV